VVDGDNVAHVRGGSENYEQVRADLVAAVVDHAARSGIETVVVFDGHGRDRTIGTTAIRHAGAETADTVIERLAHRRQHEREVTVISSDNVLRHVAQRGGVQAMSSREYVDRLAAARTADAPATPGRLRFQLADSVDPAVRAALERLRRGE
jgi:predicted RNA-binding protein with PIN domain